MDERAQALLESEDSADRIQGLRLAAAFEDTDAGTVVARLLEADPDSAVREHAARAVGVALGGAGADRLFRAATSDPDAIVRRTALAVLGEIGERAVAATLARLAPHADPADRATALEALRACGDPDQADAAAALAADPDAHVQTLALHAFAALSREPAKPRDAVRAVATLTLARGPAWAAPAAALVTGQDVRAAAARAFEDAKPRERERAVLRALELPAAALEATLLALLASPERTAEDGAARFGAARELARRGDASGALVLARVLYEPEARRQLDAAVGLAELGATIGEPALRRADGRASPTERAHVARGLALCGRPEGVKALGALLSSDLPLDRRLAAHAFADLGRADGALELARALDFPFRKERVEALASLLGLWPEGPPVFALAPATERARPMGTWLARFERP